MTNKLTKAQEKRVEEEFEGHYSGDVKKVKQHLADELEIRDKEIMKKVLTKFASSEVRYDLSETVRYYLEEAIGTTKNDK